jgi:riboflavin synthase
MFSGIIEEVGRVESYERPTERQAGTLRVYGGRLGAAAGVADSICVDGVCLTVEEKANETLVFRVVTETGLRTNFSRLHPGDHVNLEPSLTLSRPLGGHLVYGHIDATLRVIGWEREWIWVERPAVFARYIVEKGSVALNGISLTVARTDPDKFAVAIIPYTIDHTNIGHFKAGSRLNLEVDMIARYLESLAEPYLKSKG